MLKTISKAMIFSLCVALPASAQATLKSVLERYAQAINLPQLKTVRGLRQTGEFVWGGETRCRYRCDIVQTGYRSEVTLQGMTAVSAYEPAGGWQIAPFGGRTEPEKLTADESKSMGWATNLVGPLLDPQHDGAKLEYLGLKDVEGTDSHCIRVVRPSGDVELHYLDPDHFLPIRLRRTKLVRGVDGPQVQDNPSFADLVIEVSDSSLKVDQKTKQALYASASLPEYWIVNLIDQQLEVYQKPVRSARKACYESRTILSLDRSVAPLFAPQILVPVAGLF